MAVRHAIALIIFSRHHRSVTRVFQLLQIVAANSRLSVWATLPNQPEFQFSRNAALTNSYGPFLLRPLYYPAPRKGGKVDVALVPPRRPAASM